MKQAKNRQFANKLGSVTQLVECTTNKMFVRNTLNHHVYIYLQTQVCISIFGLIITTRLMKQPTQMKFNRNSDMNSCLCGFKSHLSHPILFYSCFLFFKSRIFVFSKSCLTLSLINYLQ